MEAIIKFFILFFIGLAAACSNIDQMETGAAKEASQPRNVSVVTDDPIFPQTEAADLRISNDSAVLSIGSSQFTLGIASSPSELKTGLMGLTDLGANEGLLFVFDHEDRWALWMKDTLIPLDAIWMEASGTVVHLATMPTQLGVSDSQLSLYAPPVPSLYAIELNSGSTTRAGIYLGLKIAIHTHD